MKNKDYFEIFFPFVNYILLGLKIKLLLNLYSPYYHSICNFRENGYFECTIQRNNSFLLNYMQLSSENLQHNCENLTTYKIAFR